MRTHAGSQHDFAGNIWRFRHLHHLTINQLLYQLNVQLAADQPLELTRAELGLVAFLREVIESPHMVKVGFGLKSDRGPLQRKLGLQLGASIDLATGMRKLGYKQAVGVRTAVAIALGRRLHKAKSATTSNWAAINLSEGQVQYAGEDAFAALAVFYALGLGDRPRS